jgi:excisionase family DNA binding protein
LVLQNREERRHPPSRLAYSPAEAAEALGISRSMVYTLIRAGSVRIAKIGTRTLISAAELARLLGDFDDDQ